MVRGVTHNGVTEIGPIAVHPDYQGKGVGRQLMTTVESRAKGGKCTVGIVSCRSDIIPFFEHMGYEVSILGQFAQRIDSIIVNLLDFIKGIYLFKIMFHFIMP